MLSLSDGLLSVSHHYFYGLFFYTFDYKCIFFLIPLELQDQFSSFYMGLWLRLYLQQL